MLAKREQLSTDAASFVTTLVQGLQSFLHNSPHTSRSVHRRPHGADGESAGTRDAAARRRVFTASCGCRRAPRPAVPLGSEKARLKAAEDLSDVPVETAVPIASPVARPPRRGKRACRKSRLHGALHGPRRPMPFSTVSATRSATPTGSPLA